MDFLELDKNKILEYQQNRDPFLMIDYATKVVPGVSAEGYKILNSDQWFFDVHWPGDPNMPGMLQVESLVQMSALIIQTLPGNKGLTLYLVGADKIKFFKKITPGNKLDIESKLKKNNRGIITFDAIGCIGGTKVCQAQFSLIIPGSINLKIQK